MGLCGAMADVFGDIPKARPLPLASVTAPRDIITEPTKAEWRHGDLIVRVNADETLLIGRTPDALVQIYPMAAIVLADMITNAIAWLDRRIAQEDGADS